ncbi:glycosyltransferase family 4 protein [Citricoccus sp. NPDC079358]|uniref:glycosyltransferase family 4 protein n=1 Tax=Citricoccus sp. NPDC079358 TaxID=3154653 RepID=UPI00344D1E07
MKVAIVTPILAHYRRNLFLNLDQSDGMSFVHFSAVENSTKIAAMNPQDLQEFNRLDNVEIGPFLWQKGLLGMAFDKSIDACVFTGDAKYLSTWVTSATARLMGKRVYFWTIGWHRPERGLKRLARLGFYRMAHKLMVYGDPEKASAAAHGYPEDRIDVVYNSVTGLADVETSSFGTDQKEMAVGAVVRLKPAKNLGLLIEAVSALGKRGRKLKIILGGDGPERPGLERKARDLGVDCEFLGAIHGSDEIEDFYHRVMITVVPSAAGLTTIQSLAHGVPVITDDDDSTQMPESSAVVDGVTGSRYAAGSAIDLADTIAAWIDTLVEDRSTAALACHREVKTRWNPEVQAERMLDSLAH